MVSLKSSAKKCKGNFKTNTFQFCLSPRCSNQKTLPNVDEEVAKDLFSYIEQYRFQFGVDNCEKLLHFLTQADHESGGFVYMKEVGTFTGDREKYKGRGIFQLTFQSNYSAYQEFLKGLAIEIDLVNNPEKVEDAKYAVLSALWYWQKNNLSSYAVDLTTSSLLNISKLVNCGNLEYCGYKKDANGNVEKDSNGKSILCTDCAPNGWDDRKVRFNNHKGEIKCE